MIECKAGMDQSPCARRVPDATVALQHAHVRREGTHCKTDPVWPAKEQTRSHETGDHQPVPVSQDLVIETRSDAQLAPG
jgi:hypothetical protein